MESLISPEYDVIDPLIIVVSKDEVLQTDTSAALSVLKQLTESPAVARAYIERLDIAFHGYDETHLELFEIPEVRNFVQQLDSEFPYWLFFLSKRHPGLQCLLFCKLPPYLTEEARSRIFPERIAQLMENRWLPAMNQACEFAGLSEEQVGQLTERAAQYITDGRFPLDSERFPLQ